MHIEMIIFYKHTKTLIIYIIKDTEQGKLKRKNLKLKMYNSNYIYLLLILIYYISYPSFHNKVEISVSTFQEYLHSMMQLDSFPYSSGSRRGRRYL